MDTLAVLLVDDDDDIRESLQAMFELDGHKVVAVANGPDAVIAVASRMPDVAIVDIGLPGMTGYDIANTLRQTYPTAPLRLIALSGYGQQLDRITSKAAGFDHHLTKPPELRALAALLSEVADQKRERLEKK